jgi:hypothetical protein
MGNPDRPELGQELTNSLCRTDPEIAEAFTRVTFKSDNRADLAKVVTPMLILQRTDEIIASKIIGELSIAQSKGAIARANRAAKDGIRREYLSTSFVELAIALRVLWDNAPQDSYPCFDC